MDELDVLPGHIRDESDMSDLPAALAGGEEHQVARLKVFLLDLLPYARLIFGRTRERKVDRLESMNGKSGAVHAGAGGTTVFIRSTHEGSGSANDFVNLFGAKLCFLRSTTCREK